MRGTRVPEPLMNWYMYFRVEAGTKSFNVDKRLIKRGFLRVTRAPTWIKNFFPPLLFFLEERLDTRVKKRHVQNGCSKQISNAGVGGALQEAALSRPAVERVAFHQ